MLLQFTVENYKSIKHKAILSMEASSDQELPDNLAICDQSRILRSAAVYGANAAGKSNVFKAIAAALHLINKSNERKRDDELSEIVPFLYDSDSAKTPTSFEFVFTATDGIKYVYGFSATQTKIVTEYLYWFKTTEPSIIFERNMNGETGFSFPDQNIAQELEPITKRNPENKLFLCTATSWNAEVTREPFQWLDHNVTVITANRDTLAGCALKIYEKLSDSKSLKTFTQQLLHEADLNITDYSIYLIAKNTYEIKMDHIVSTGDWEFEKYSSNLKDESDGTFRLFMLSPILQQTFLQGFTLCIDEFDASLHPFLVKYLLGLFHEPTVNKKNAQLIFSSHTVELMSQDVMRRDQIYFVEKDHATAQSELFSLDEFIYKEGEDRCKAYLLGLYGAVPALGLGEIEC